MDILAILFLIFGWIYKVKGLVITSLILISICTSFAILKMYNSKSEEDKKKQASIFAFDVVLLAFSIIKLCIW
ncbi:hypothetical protein II906_11005 [bacterium]|nr:hypothetical protein [bacterium]